MWGDQGDAREAGRDNLPPYQQGNAGLPTWEISRIQNTYLIVLL